MSGYGNGYQGSPGSNYGGGYNGGYNRGYGGGGGGGGGGGYGRKRGREDDNYSSPNFRRRQNDRGDYAGSPGGGGYGQQGNRRSMGGGGGGGGQYDRQGGQSVASMQTRFKEGLWKLGNNSEYDPAIDLPQMGHSVIDWYFRDKSVVFQAFRAAVSELPHKLPHYAALLAHLSTKPSSAPVSLAARISAPSTYSRPSASASASASDRTAPAPALAPGLPAKPMSEEEALEAAAVEGAKNGETAGDAEEEQAEKVNVGKEIVKDLMKAFQAFLDERKWKSVRYSVTLFTLLTSLPPSSPIVSASSLITLLSSFVAVLDEPGLRAARGDECVRIIVEALLRLDTSLVDADSGLNTLRDGVQGYLASRRVERELFADEETKGQWQDPLEQLITSLSSASGSDAEGTVPVSSITADPHNLITLAPSDEDGAPAAEGEEPLMLPMILVPPESDEGDLTLGAATGVEHAIPPPPISAGLRGNEGVGYEGSRLTLRLFDDETVPTLYDPAGILVRSLISDLITLYETNRKEAATLLLELPRWFKKGTFRAPAQAKKDDEAEADEEMSEGPQWSLETLIVETIVTSILATPSAPLPLIYYYSLLTELCRISPATIAPSLGKSVRKLYASLGNENEESANGVPVLDAEGVRRFADWFSVHLSNYGFKWGWADWAPDMEVSPKHPKRVFVKRTLDLEIRLSYFDRVRNTIPEAMLDTGIMASEAPGPEYAYESADHTHSAAAMSFLKLIRQKAPISEAEEELAAFQKALEAEHNLTPDAAEKVKRDLAVQTVLHVGSRSFSHFLNALERYLTLLRNLTPSPATRQHLLDVVASFWRRNPQFHLIVLDKLLQYRLIDTRDVVAWIFAPTSEPDGEGETAAGKKTWSDLDLWAQLQLVLRTVQSRVDSAQGRVEGLKREAEARAAAQEEGAARDGEAALDAEGDLALRDAPAANPDDEREIQMAASAVDEVQDELAVTLVDVLGHFAKLLPGQIDKADWENWWVEGWVREFCRTALKPKVLALPAVSEGIEKLDLASVSPAVKTIVDAGRAWHDFA
ncbi:hypothetical protein JCM10207_006907 [Rhodosporidiobolus poonsookiae]